MNVKLSCVMVLCLFLMPFSGPCHSAAQGDAAPTPFDNAAAWSSRRERGMDDEAIAQEQVIEREAGMDPGIPSAVRETQAHNGIDRGVFSAAALIVNSVFSVIVFLAGFFVFYGLKTGKVPFFPGKRLIQPAYRFIWSAIKGKEPVESEDISFLSKSEQPALYWIAVIGAIALAVWLLAEIIGSL